MSSVLSLVRSSVRRAHDDAAGWTHTNGIPRSAASWANTRHRCPVGSHATVTPADPARPARSAAQSSAAPIAHALHLNVLRASTLESWSHTTTICLRSARSIPTIAFVTGTAARSRTRRAFRLRSPRDTPLPLVMNVLLEAMGLQAQTAHQEDVRHARPRPLEHLPMPQSSRSFLLASDRCCAPFACRVARKGSGAVEKGPEQWVLVRGHRNTFLCRDERRGGWRYVVGQGCAG